MRGAMEVWARRRLVAILRNAVAFGRRSIPAGCVGLLALLVPHVAGATPTTGTGGALTGIGRAAAPLVAREMDVAEPAPSPEPTPSAEPAQQAEQQQQQGAARQQQGEQQEEEEPPPILDPIDGPVFSILGGSVFSGSSAFQTGAAFAYFFGAKARVGIEVEGDITFGPAGRVTQVMGSFIYQTGARTSKFVPFFAIGGGYLRATSEYPLETEEALDRFGINPEPRTEEGPFFQYGGGLRYYIKPRVAFRADARFALVPLNLEVDTNLWDRMFGMSRLVGMLSFDF